jgi:hypothetical protein
MNGNATALSDVLVPDVLRNFELAQPGLVDARALQQRVDRKYLVAVNGLEALVARLCPDYCLLRAGQQVWARYESVYFDTLDRALFHAHRRGLRPRFKVRVRHHLDRELSFLEVKRKERSGRTVKYRLEMPFGKIELGPREHTFIEGHTPLDAECLLPRLSISFRRLTLLGRDINERVTIDRQFMVKAGTHSEQLDRIVIAEVKQPRFVNYVGAVAVLRSINAIENALSKYCLGTILVAPVRANIFKPAMRAVERLSA